MARGPVGVASYKAPPGGRGENYHNVPYGGHGENYHNTPPGGHGENYRNTLPCGHGANYHNAPPGDHEGKRTAAAWRQELPVVTLQNQSRTEDWGQLVGCARHCGGAGCYAG